MALRKLGPLVAGAGRASWRRPVPLPTAVVPHIILSIAGVIAGPRAILQRDLDLDAEGPRPRPSGPAHWVPEYGHGIPIELNGRLVHRWAMIEAED